MRPLGAKPRASDWNRADTALVPVVDKGARRAAARYRLRTLLKEVEADMIARDWSECPEVAP